MSSYLVSPMYFAFEPGGSGGSGSSDIVSTFSPFIVVNNRVSRLSGMLMMHSDPYMIENLLTETYA